MAVFIIPTRIIPGCLLGGLFAGIGLFSSAAVSISLAQHRFRPISLIALPLLAVTIWFIAHVWRRRSGSTTASQATSLSPRLLAGILAVSLVVGLVTGSMLGTLSSQ